MIGYLHTGIEKNMEFRTWTQGVTFCTRMDYLAPLFNETAYCLAVERLLGIEAEIPERATVLRVLMMELNRISSHLTAIGTFGLELGATTVFIYGLREREKVLDLFELITGLRMNHAYVRPGGVSQDLPGGRAREAARVPAAHAGAARRDPRRCSTPTRSTCAGRRDVAYLDLAGCMALGVTGPILRATGLPWDLRKSQPYCGYETYEFDVPTQDTCDAYGRYLVRMDEMDESLQDHRAVRGPAGRAAPRPRPGDDRQRQDRLARPARGRRRTGWATPPTTSRTSWASRWRPSSTTSSWSPRASGCPPGRSTPPSSPRAASWAATRSATAGPGRTGCTSATPRSPTCRRCSAMCEGGMVADVIAAVASIDPVMGGVDR